MKGTNQIKDEAKNILVNGKPQPVDFFFSNSIDKSIKNLLGYSDYRKFKKRAAVDLDISTDAPILDLKKFVGVLVALYGDDGHKIMKKILSDIVKAKKEKDEIELEILDDDIVNMFLETFGDQYKKKMLDIANVKDHVSLDMLSSNKIPQASGYRRIKELVDNGLLVEVGMHSPERGRRAPKYISLIDKIHLDIGEEFKTIMKIKINQIFLKDSVIIKYLIKKQI